jgi:hypothetical protein
VTGATSPGLSLEVLVIDTILQVLESEFTPSVEVALGVRGAG